jgi:hypothetical protein
MELKVRNEMKQEEDVTNYKSEVAAVLQLAGCYGLQ